MSTVKDKARADALDIGRFQPDLLTGSDETGPSLFFQPGTYEWLVWGTWDGAVATLQQSPDNEDEVWIDFNAATSDADGRITGVPIAKSRIRVKIESAGPTTNLFSSFNRIY